MTFSGDLKAFAAKVQARQKDIFQGCVGAVRTSIVDGSSITSAPGQPVDTSNLRRSWREEYPQEWVGTVLSYDVPYAEAIEEGQQNTYWRQTERGTGWGYASVRISPKPMTRRSEVGGFHSVKLTRSGWQNIVDHVVKEVVHD